MHIVNHRRRIVTVYVFFFIGLLFCAFRLAYIQFFRANYLAGIARKQHSVALELEPRRGTIYDTNLKPQAVNISAYSLFANPKVLSRAEKNNLLKILPQILGADIDFLRERLLRNKSFVWLARKLTDDQVVAVRKLKIKGFDFIKETKRCYPNGYLLSHVLGFAGLDNNGLEGVELAFNQYLKGESGFALCLRDARQNKLEIWEKMSAPRDGYDLVLTIDEVVQYIAERELDKAFRQFNAQGASIIVMNPRTGEILAFANRPTYDLNEYAGASKESMRNRAICDLFEPGSVFKIVTASAALEERKVNENSRFFCENGAWNFGSHTLHDHQPHGWLTFSEVIEQSSNIGTVKVAQLLGPPLLHKYIKSYGFGAKTGLELHGEINGMNKDPRNWSKTSIGAVPIGQEVGVTALQLVAAVSVIANGGQLVKPYLVKEIRDQYGETVKYFSPAPVRRVISESTAARMRKILTKVIEQGTGKLAKPASFSAAGKTGTAQKLDPNGAYSHDKFVGSFIGFAPADNPQIAMVVTLDEPHPYYYGGVVSAPVFKNVAEDVLKYLNYNLNTE